MKNRLTLSVATVAALLVSASFVAPAIADDTADDTAVGTQFEAPATEQDPTAPLEDDTTEEGLGDESAPGEPAETPDTSPKSTEAPAESGETVEQAPPQQPRRCQMLRKRILRFG